MTQQADDVVTPVHKGAFIADPAPLGLAAFALTTFVLSCVNAGWFKGEPVVFGLALAYGGIAQLLAGMWEFAKGNTFGGTAFASYGAFWISFWYLTGHTDMSKLAAGDISKGVGLYLLAWGIFTLLMLVAVLKVNGALISVFLLLTITYFLLAFGAFGSNEGLTKAGGYFGVLTAIAAWYTALAGLMAFTNGRQILPTFPRS